MAINLMTKEEFRAGTVYGGVKGSNPSLHRRPQELRKIDAALDEIHRLDAALEKLSHSKSSRFRFLSRKPKDVENEKQKIEKKLADKSSNLFFLVADVDRSKSIDSGNFKDQNRKNDAMTILTEQVNQLFEKYNSSPSTGRRLSF